MADATNLETMQTISVSNQPNSDGEDASAVGTYGIRPMFQQIQATLRKFSLAPQWIDINGLQSATWSGGLTPTFISATQFSYQGDQTGFFVVNSRIQAILMSGSAFGTVTVSSYNNITNSTTVTVVMDSTPLDATLSNVQISSISPSTNPLPATVVTQTNTPLSAVASGTNTYTANLSPAITAYKTNQFYIVVFTNGNTGAATLNLNSLGAVNIVKQGNKALVGNEIQAGQAEVLVYNGTNFQLIGVNALANAVVIKPTDQGVTNSTVLVNDNALTFAVGANQSWEFNLVLDVTTGASGNNGGCKAAITVPAGASLSWTSNFVSAGATTPNLLGTVVSSSGTGATVINSALGGTEFLVNIVGVVTMGGTAGSVTLQFAQASATATATTVKTGSSLTAEQLV